MTIESWETSLACPRCKVPMFGAMKGTFELSACGACGGVWLDNQASQRVVQAFSPTAEQLAELAAKAATRAARPAGPAQCPQCQAAMESTTVGAANIEIDVCAAHGTWFDKHELSRVMSAIHPVTPAPALQFAAFEDPTPAPTARDLAREIVLEQRRQKTMDEGVASLFRLLGS